MFCFKLFFITGVCIFLVCTIATLLEYQPTKDNIDISLINGKIKELFNQCLKIIKDFQFILKKDNKNKTPRENLIDQLIIPVKKANNLIIGIFFRFFC